MSTDLRNFGWVKDSLIIILILIILVNYKNPKIEYRYIYEPQIVYIEVEKEIIKEIENPTYIEVPLIIELKPEDITPAIKKKKEIPYISANIPNNNGFKSYMGYTAITKTSSPQYKLQQWAHTDYEGFRIYEGRYIVAVGSGVGARIGQYLDVILENGTHIPCVVGDMKGDKDTDASNMFTSNGCCLEFIVDTKALIPSVKSSGNCSSARTEWASPVDTINVLERIVVGL